MPERILVLSGPTAVGKSKLALELAERIGGEIVSADSRQVYRGLDVGTAKPTTEERARVRHHFVDERDLTERFTAGQFAREAEGRIADIRARGRIPIVVGGSLLYVNALVRGIADLPPLSPEGRDAIAAEASSPEGRRALFEELVREDPEAAATLDETKSHRLIRLVGLLRVHGPPSEFWRQAPLPRFAYRLLVLDRPRASLYRRIDARVDAMLARGLVEETRRLMEAGHVLDRGALHTIGYAEPSAFLRGEVSCDEMTRLIQRNTRRFAKRQSTWLRRWDDAVWLDAETTTAESLLEITSTATG